MAATVDEMPPGVVIADCPCGNGRWWETLSRRAERIVALDVSVGMLRYAGERTSRTSLDVNLSFGNAEKLPLRDASVDYTFCHALGLCSLNGDWRMHGGDHGGGTRKVAPALLAVFLHLA